MNVFAGKRGFTLIELLVVIAIIGLLSSIVLASLNTARAKARDAQRESEIEQLRTALAMYYADHGVYPASGGATLPNGSWSNSNDSSWATLQTKLAPYIASLPHDPSESSSGSAQDGSQTYLYFAYNNAEYCNLGWYIIVWRPEGSVTSPGSTDCSGVYRNYGGTVTISP